jgi:LexA-binding, inner membrane-associated putative hydrolase
MTTPEHTLVGIHLAFALGCHRILGWSAVAMAGVASNLPDWDGLPMLFDMQRFEIGHRVWGHNLAAITLSSILISWSQHHYRWIEIVSNWILKKLPDHGLARTTIDETSKQIGTLTFFGIAMFVQVVHLPCDMVVSGGIGLSDWAIQPLWPFSNAGYVYPMIPWGDIGPTLILMSGVICSAKWPNNVSRSSLVTLLALCTYLLVRGWTRGMLFS